MKFCDLVYYDVLKRVVKPEFKNSHLTHVGIDSNYKFNFEDGIRARHDWINIISPAAICFENECFRINGQVEKCTL